MMTSIHPSMDFHVHTTYSDGRAHSKDMIEKAIKLGINNLGITDHYGGLESYAIISTDKLSQYIAELAKLKQIYHTKINLWIGLETAFLDDLPFALLNKLDYMLFEDIETDPRLGYFLSQVKPNLNIPAGMAHPQIILLENSIDILEQKEVFIELNTHYTGRYESKWSNSVWQKLAAKDICVTVASDAHDLKRVGDISSAIEFLEHNNLTGKLGLPKAANGIQLAQGKTLTPNWLTDTIKAPCRGSSDGRAAD